MPAHILLKYILALSLSLLIETPIAYLLLRRYGRVRNIIAAAVVGTLVTHLFIHFYMIRTLHLHGLKLHILAESLAVAIEAIIYLAIVRPRKKIFSLYASLAANAASYIAGLFIF